MNAATFRNCRLCDKPFSPTTHRSFYCGDTCKREADRSSRRAARAARGGRIIECRICGQQVTVRNAAQRRCDAPKCIEATARIRSAADMARTRTRYRRQQEFQAAMQRLLCSRWGRAG